MEFIKPILEPAAMQVKENPVVRGGAFFLVLFMLSLPFSTTISIAMTFLVFGCWVLASLFRDLPRLVRHNPVAGSAILLYGLFLAGTGYGDAASEDALSMLRKYREIPLVVIFIPFLQEEKYRRWIIAAFIVTCFVTLLGSYLKDFELLPLNKYNAAAFKSRITHSLLMALFAYFCAYRAASTPRRRSLWVGVFLLAVFNIFVIVEGRTGQVVFVLLMVLLFFQRLKTKWTLILAFLVLFCFLGLIILSNNRFQEGLENSRDYFQGQENLETSMGQRLYFWQISMRLIREKPVFGYGTGSFASEFKRLTQNKDFVSQNPHNEYLMISVQLGAMGLAAYLLFLTCQWRCSFYLPEDRRWFAQGIALSLAVNSLFNTTFLDHTEGHLYACLIALSFTVAPRHPSRRTHANSKQV